MKTSAQRLWNITLVGLKAILRNKMRSLLTMLGIVIGVGCVIVVVAIGNGATKSIQDTINSLGSNFIMIFPGTTTQGGARMFSGSSTLTIEDADAIKAEAPAVAYVSPNLRTSAQTVAGELNWGTSVYGVGVDWPFIRSCGSDRFWVRRSMSSCAMLSALVQDCSASLVRCGLMP